MSLRSKITTLLAIGVVLAPASAEAAFFAGDLPARQVNETILSWRDHVGRGPLSVTRQRVLVREAVFNVEAVASASRARFSLRVLQVSGGRQGPAVYLDLVVDAPARFLRHGQPLVRALAAHPFLGGWAVRLRDRSGGTVWIAGHAGNWGFVWSRPDLAAISPVAHW